MRILPASASVVVAVLCLAPPARGQEEGAEPPAPPPAPPPAAAAEAAPAGSGGAAAFGAPGQIAVSADLRVEFKHDISSATVSGMSTTRSVTALTLAPAADYFVSQNLSIGGRVGFTQDRGTSIPTRTEIFLGPRAGYHLVLAPAFSFWPSLEILFTQKSRENESGTAFTLRAYGPFLWHPVAHFFIGLGPEVSVDLYNKFEMVSDRHTIIRVVSTIGGWWGPR